MAGTFVAKKGLLLTVEREQEYRDFVLAASGTLFRTAFVLTNDRHLAEDLVQQALIKVWRYWERVREADDEYSYARRIVFTSYSRTHRRRRVREVLGESTVEAIAQDQDDVGDRDGLRRALAALSPTQRAVLVLRFYEDLTAEQAANALGCSVGTVKSRTSRALQQLRLSPHLDAWEGR
jgi:RNA polymerase sigma-70 factor (sigma-E family)